MTASFWLRNPSGTGMELFAAHHSWGEFATSVVHVSVAVEFNLHNFTLWTCLSFTADSLGFSVADYYCFFMSLQIRYVLMGMQDEKNQPKLFPCDSWCKYLSKKARLIGMASTSVCCNYIITGKSQIIVVKSKAKEQSLKLSGEIISISAIITTHNYCQFRTKKMFHFPKGNVKSTNLHI